MRRYITIGTVTTEESERINVALISPIERAKAKAPPVARAGRSKGRSILRNVWGTVAPRVKAACVYDFGILRYSGRIDRSTNGEAITVWASTINVLLTTSECETFEEIK
jgi:hypothetical protein